MAVRLAELDGVAAAAPPDHGAYSRRMTELVADLIEPARSAALDKLGEGERAFGMATAWLRARIEPGAVGLDW
jgi:hypothetical protein